MTSAFIVGVVALLINAWADPQLALFACIAILAAVLFWRRESLASRTVFRAAVSTVLACLLNFIVFAWNDFNRYGEIKPVELQPSAIVTKAPPLLDSALAVLKPGTSRGEEEEARMQSRYLTALSGCIDDRQTQQRLSYKAAKNKCLETAAQIGRSAFLARYFSRVRPDTDKSAGDTDQPPINSGS